MSLIDLVKELQKPEYIQLSNEDALSVILNIVVPEGNLIPATTVNQIFASLDLTGVIQDIANDPQHKFRHKMASVILSIGGNHLFNFISGTTSGNGNLAMLDNMIAEIPDLSTKLTYFKNTVYHLSNLKKKYSNVTLDDIIKARSTVLDGQWYEMEATNNRTFVIRLTQPVPEQTYVLIEMQDQYEDGTTSEWYHATALHGLTIAKEYIAALPYNGYIRKLRWKCEYSLAGNVSTR